MFRTLKKRIKNEKGLSLVELLAVIVILGIISAIAVPAIGNIIANSQAKAEIADAVQILNSAKLYEMDGNTLPFEKANAGDYVEVSDRITAFSVTKNDAGLYVIAFTGEKLGAVAARTLVELSGATVSGGEVETWGTTTP